jgi:hypothetical protein
MLGYSWTFHAESYAKRQFRDVMFPPGLRYTDASAMTDRQSRTLIPRLRWSISTYWCGIVDPWLPIAPIEYVHHTLPEEGSM